MSNVPSVPKPDDADVLELLRLHMLREAPRYVTYSDFGYAPRYCHISAKHRAIVAGGRRVHGWALWRWDIPQAGPGKTIIFAEHHSVWEDPDGRLVDVTPPPGDAKVVLFVPDGTATINEDDKSFLIRTDLTNWPDVPRVFRGNPTTQHFWPLDRTDSHAIAYASILNFDLRRIVTEDQQG